MREMIMRRWCDQCWYEGQLQQEAVKTYTIGIVVGETRPMLKVLELCENHDKLAVDLMAMLHDIGQLPDLTAAKKKPVPPPATTTYAHPETECPVCRVIVGRNTLVAHVWNKHRTDQRPATPKNCPECGEFFDNGTGMSAHRRSTHDYDALKDALSGVKGYKP